jgi:two-component system response regulator
MNERFLMLVEDNPRDEELMRVALRRTKITNDVVIARDGAEALDYLFATGAHAGRNTAEQPAVILLDINLPKIDGLEVLRRIRNHERTRLIPVVLLTSSNEDRDLLEGYASGANSYVQKAIDFTRFSEAVRQLGVYWLVLNEPPPPVGEP